MRQAYDYWQDQPGSANGSRNGVPPGARTSRRAVRFSLSPGQQSLRRAAGAARLVASSLCPLPGLQKRSPPPVRDDAEPGTSRLPRRAGVSCQCRRSPLRTRVTPQSRYEQQLVCSARWTPPGLSDVSRIALRDDCSPRSRQRKRAAGKVTTLARPPVVDAVTRCHGRRGALSCPVRLSVSCPGPVGGLCSRATGERRGQLHST